MVSQLWALSFAPLCLARVHRREIVFSMIYHPDRSLPGTATGLRSQLPCLGM